VFDRGGQILRAVDDTCFRTLETLSTNGLLRQLEQELHLVRTQFVPPGSLQECLRSEHPGFVHFIEHERVECITYPFEWSFSMLRVAALLTLDIQLALLSHGYSLKDATAYNVFFEKGEPRFVDIASIHTPKRLDLWYALGQFHRMFLYPLMLCSFCGWDLRSYFLANLQGRDAQQIVDGLGRLERWRPRWLLDVTLPYVIEAVLLKKRARRVGSPLDQQSGGAAAQILTLKRLRRKIRKLPRARRSRGVWADYNATCNYDDCAERSKKEQVAAFLKDAKPATVLDLGCNTGDYSYIAAEAGAKVVAADADHDAVDLLFHRLQSTEAKITPLVVDITNPSPGIGYRNIERPSFFERVRADCVLALALIHHLHVSGNLSLCAIRDMLYELTNEHLVLEFVPATDSMFQRLVAFRTESHPEYTFERTRQVFRERFVEISDTTIASSSRRLLILQKT